MERFLFLSLIVIAVGSYRDVSAEKPIMMPQQDQLVIQEGSALKIKCYSKGASVHFSFPAYSFMSPRSDHIVSTADDGTSTFLRQNTVSLDTGWYACAEKGVKIKNNFKNLNHSHKNIAWIYVYVNSSEPFSDRFYTFPKSIIAVTGKPAIVPCRPTSPHLEVQLWQNSKIVNLTEKIRFDPRIGFVIEQLVFKDLVIHFHCEVDGVKDRYDLYYSKLTGQKPKMRPNAEEMSISEGKELKIECYGGSNVQFFFPRTNKKTDFLIVTTSSYNIREVINGKNDKRTFVRRSTVADDTGWYGCSEEGINSDIPYHNYIDYTRTEINWIYVYVESSFKGLIGRESLDVLTRDDGVQYVDGNDVSVPCRPTSFQLSLPLRCQFQLVERDETVRFDPKYGFILKRELNDSIYCCSCLTEASKMFDVLCSRKVSEKEKELYLKPQQFLLLTGEDLRLSLIRINIAIVTYWTWSLAQTESENRVGRTSSIATFPKMPINMALNGFTTLLLRSLTKNRVKRTVLMEPFTGTSELQAWQVFYGLQLRNVTVNDSGDYIFQMQLSAINQEKRSLTNVLVVDRKQFEYEKLNLQDAYEFVRRRNESLKMMVDLQSFSSGMIQWYKPLL